MLRWFESVVRSNPCCVVDECINGPSVGCVAHLSFDTQLPPDHEDACLRLFDGEIALPDHAVSVGKAVAICLELSVSIVREINNSEIAQCITLQQNKNKPYYRAKQRAKWERFL